MNKAFTVAFTEWDKRYRENPNYFWNEVERLLGSTPETYGKAASAFFVSLLDELAAGKPWNTIGADEAQSGEQPEAVEPSKP